jgi:hypothetical protein
VRIPAKAGETSGRWRYRDRDSDEFLDRCRAASYIEIVEVKNQLAPAVIGQAHIGRLLLEKSIAPSKATVRPVVLWQGEAEGWVAEFCHELGVTLWKTTGGGKPSVGHGLPELHLVAKRERPTRGAIGQLITADFLLQKARSSQLRISKVIEYKKEGNKSVLELCDELHIKVRPASPASSNQET